MTRITIAGGAFGAILIPVVLAACQGDAGRGNAGRAAPAAVAAADGHQGLLHGRVTTDDGEVYEGRLRFGGDEEALWGNQFNGYKDENPWAAHVPPERLPRERVSGKVLGIEIGVAPRADLGRPFMARLGDIARIEARGRDLQVTLKSGTVFHLDRYAADDFADGVRVWDENGAFVDLGERRIRSIELLPGARSGNGPSPLHGTVRTRHGAFTGLVQWDREAALGGDLLRARGAGGEVSLRFDAIRSISRRPGEGAAVTLRDGREIVLSETRRDGRPNRGMYVDDPRYGRVLVSWDAFDRVDFSPGGAVPAYDDFRPGRPLRGTVLTRDGRRLTGRLVHDLDESETTETLDAPLRGVDYAIPFALIASIESIGEAGDRAARVTLRSGELLLPERAGDLADSNAGMLIFPEGGERPVYVPWTELQRVEFDLPREGNHRSDAAIARLDGSRPR